MVHACNDRGAIMEQLLDIIVKIAWPVYLESLNPLLVQLSQKFSRELMHIQTKAKQCFMKIDLVLLKTPLSDLWP